MTNWELLYSEMEHKNISERALSLAINRSHGWLHIARKRNSDLKASDIQNICEVMNLDLSMKNQIFFAS